MIPILISNRTKLRPCGRILHACTLCGQLVPHELAAVESQRRLNGIIALGPVRVIGHLATCSQCRLARAVTGEAGEGAEPEVPYDDLLAKTPSAVQARAKALREVHEKAATEGAAGEAARGRLLDLVLVDLDDAWSLLPEYDTRTRLFFGGALGVVTLSLVVGLLAGDAWLAPIAAVGGVAAMACIGAATWSAIVGRPREARRTLVPAVQKALATMPFVEDDVEQALDRARARGSALARFPVLRPEDLARRRDETGGPYRAGRRDA